MTSVSFADWRDAQPAESRSLFGSGATKKLRRHSHYIFLLTFIGTDIFIFPVFYYTRSGLVFFFCMYVYKYLKRSGPPAAGSRCCCLRFLIPESLPSRSVDLIGPHKPSR